ncbi:hypothetical protein HEK616_08110 [Streptomyces nigrescens]|uniref:Secreted protein n=1 Tax=Streptomyces nigrescens TaxID=1920 RepID=A0ABN6QS27_STRNI|nr:hypothetical protein HEK616_08110 [Streptomyces nigrescens]
MLEITLQVTALAGPWFAVDSSVPVVVGLFFVLRRSGINSTGWAYGGLRDWHDAVRHRRGTTRSVNTVLEPVRCPAVVRPSGTLRVRSVPCRDIIYFSRA